jgi:glutamyl-tRNA(Gln) amidotransferase subunit E
MNWKKLGLKCGLEIHQQLDTRKLFCGCPSLLRYDKPDLIIKRRLRAVAGELGEVDIAARAEEIKAKEFIYELYSDTNCLVETDSEPPHPLNQEALRIALEIALLLNMKPVDEVQVMRKTVVDGSNTAGFQRTCLVARDGWIETSFGRVGITTLCLEEDSARKIEEGKDYVIFRLDRLGIPLVEIRTAPQMHSPAQVLEVAQQIGLVLRSTRKVKRGIGTIRQDINISIKEGARIEIKGAQELKLIPKLVEYEAIRQKKLIELSRLVGKAEERIYDLSNLFSETRCKLIKEALSEKKSVLGIKLKGWGGFLAREIQPGKRLSQEFYDYARAYGVQGIIHSDELPRYGISNEEVGRIKRKLRCGRRDAFILLVESKTKARRILKILIQRSMQKVPKEVRRANPDGTTTFLRPLPGPARLYPETDAIPIRITQETLREIKKALPERSEEKLKRFLKLHKLSKELASQLARSEALELYEELVSRFKKVDPKVIASTLLMTPKEIRKRYRIDISRLKKEHFEQVLELLERRKIARAAIIKILKELATDPELKAREIVASKKLQRLSRVKVEQVMKEVIRKNPRLAKEKKIRALMRIAIKRIGARADGKLLFKILKKLVR